MASLDHGTEGNSYTFALAREVKAVVALALTGAAFDGLVMPPLVEAVAETAQTIGFTAGRAIEMASDPFEGVPLPSVVRQGSIISRG